jgi:hypothetical protein
VAYYLSHESRLNGASYCAENMVISCVYNKFLVMKMHECKRQSHSIVGAESNSEVIHSISYNVNVPSLENNCLNTAGP